MWESITTLIKSVPTWYLMLLLPFVIVLGVWVYSRMRRDKNGKLYFYSQKYEDAKRNRKQDALLERMDNVFSQTKKNRKDILQLQLCSVNMPTTGKRMAYLEYTQSGFNSWADQYVIDQSLFTPEEVQFVKMNNNTVGWNGAGIQSIGQFSRRAQDAKTLNPPIVNEDKHV